MGDKTKGENVHDAARTFKWEVQKRPAKTHSSTLYFVYVPPIIQEGPTCGLVAISMMTSITSSFLTCDYLLNVARSLGYTQHGEMFSAKNLQSLLEVVLEGVVETKWHRGGLITQRSYVLDQLMRGTLYLVPYDVGPNGKPVCRNGHRAHWALLCGAAFCNSQPYVLARQGHSKKFGFWSFDQLSVSNSSLAEVCPTLVEAKSYILTDPKVGLAGQYVSVKLIKK